MIFDKETQFSDGQAITASAASTNLIDLGATGTPYGSAVALERDIGKGCTIPVVCMVSEAFNNLTSLKVAIEVDDNAAFSSAKEVAARTYTLAELDGGILDFPSALIEGTDERYVRLYYTVTGTTAPTTGAITAGVVAARQTNL